ncbi:entry exclusion protein 2 [Escherichia coli]|uniref:Exc2 family lipoprotein n=1 Tax=Escherichia coli TaxID=562 RepID=UPI0006187C37|nr:Exc2 family lipoprotein [Escherichia coli]EFN7364434.1 entry exclusion protein 2 [Escherichia coli O180:H14]AKC15897.1 entry exclusion protein 2 [Escherichia coli]APK96796.1 entry exclusion protein 2 [Escherichia coli]APL01655.1 entry exclusion protein 2 [Escherichia coli]APL35716.1 entry exclusion protein 2 [Escherichia coli]
MRRSGGTLFLIVLLTATTLLTACTPKGCVEQHTRHYVYASDDSFDPNFSTQKADTTRMMVPFFRQFWDMGAKDKAAGKSRNDVQQHIQQFHSQEFLNSLQGTTQFAGTDYRSKDLTPKKSRLLADTISAVYLDGYEGRQ